MTNKIVTIYHNPRCSKSRQTLTLLQEKGIEPNIIEYLNTPPTQSELEDVLKRLNLKPRELMRTGESTYKELCLDDINISDEKLIQAMLSHPILIERPIVVTNNKATIGRPPENVLDIL